MIQYFYMAFIILLRVSDTMDRSIYLQLVIHKMQAEERKVLQLSSRIRLLTTLTI